MTRARGNSPRPPHSPLQIAPLGGLGEFGLNCTVLRYGRDRIVIDAGLMFPEEQLLGVNIVIPDMSHLLDHADELRGVIITHAHEDHVGALPYLYEKIRIPVYGSDFTLGLAARKLREHRLPHERQLKRVRAGDEVTLGPFRLRFIQITHSIPGTLALAITTPVGTLIHTADFKLDQTPVDDRPTEFRTLSAYGDRGVLALLSDSTNAEVEGLSGSERSVRESLDSVFRRAEARIVVSTFASNIHRLQQIIDLAVAHKRRVALVGSSMVSTAEVAMELGHLRVPAGTMIEPRAVRRTAPHKVVVVAAGSQGEPMSALSRIALDDHKDVHLEPGDLVLISARAIPGNERSINSVINHVYRRGADIIFGGRPPYHVSGHACQEELKIMLSMVRPRFFIPIHGEVRQLHSHARLAEGTGLPRDRILLAESGDVIELSGRKARIRGKVPVGRVLIDGTLEEVDEIIVRDRRHISAGGIVLAIVAIDKRTGAVEGSPEIVSRGFVLEGARRDLLRRASDLVRQTVLDATPEERADHGVIKALIQQDLKRFFRKHLDRRPMIIPAVIET